MSGDERLAAVTDILIEKIQEKRKEVLSDLLVRFFIAITLICYFTAAGKSFFKSYDNLNIIHFAAAISALIAISRIIILKNKKQFNDQEIQVAAQKILAVSKTTQS